MRDGIMDGMDPWARARQEQEKRNAAMGGTAASPQPPCDNAHVAKGCEPFHPHLHPCDSPMPDSGGAMYAGQAKEEPLIWRLRREAQSYGEQAYKKARAVELLERHPEFQELIELLRLVPIY